MLKAKDFRRYAKEALSGRWLKAGAVSLVAGLLGAAIGTFTSGSGANNAQTEEELSSLFSGGLGGTPDVSAMVFASVMGVALIVLLWAIVILIIGGAATLGYAKYNLNLVDDKDPKFGDLFSQFHRLGTGFGMQFFRGLFVFLWSLLFVIPGIIASYSYYMTPFILCENPDMTAREAIRKSKELMKGNKLRLFCLELSFFGWYIVAIVVLMAMLMISIVPISVIGSSIDTTATLLTVFIVMILILILFCVLYTLTLSPYVTASLAVFYREISEERYSSPKIEAEDFVYEAVQEEQAAEYSE